MVDADVLKSLKPESLTGIAPRIRDGDLLLCSAHDPFSRLIGLSTHSPWTHVALAWRWPSLGRIMVFEAVQKIGVRTVPMATFLRQSSTGVKPYPGKIVLARHRDFAKAHGGGEGARARRFADFAVDKLGDPFSPIEVAKIGVRIGVGALGRKMPRSLGPRDEFICSEYVARCFAAIGIQIAWDKEGFIAPADFANDPKVAAIARFRTR
ncbi:MAG TPA: hypothetical protein VG166_06260 [Caulobacteraceae bacterium]|nr:hypothetical protein [Caulobacteraceae bacterium]